jgi:signal transduction histidine kinase
VLPVRRMDLVHAARLAQALAIALLLLKCAMALASQGDGGGAVPVVARHPPQSSRVAASQANPSVTATTPKQVLILDSFGREVAPFTAAVTAFRTTLARELGEPVHFYDESLDAALSAQPERERAFVAFLQARFGDRPPDVVVPIGAPAVRFVAQFRDRVFPDTPIVYTAVEPRMLPPDALRANATLVTQAISLSGIVEDILQMQPDTTNIAVVLGTSPLEQFWVGQSRREFQRFSPRVGFTWLTDMTLPQVLERSAALPPHSFILFGMFVVDAAGVPFDQDEALRRLHAVANAPLFGYFGSEFGLGAIGGRLYQDAEVGVRAARAAIRILHGERPESIPPQILEAGAPVFDWRELRRWGISEARLPPGSVIRFREPTVWERYRWRIVAAVALLVLQTGLIIALLINRARRRVAERTARGFHGRLIRAHEEERARLARELHDDVTQRLARLAIDAAQVERSPSALAASETAGSLREGLVRLSEDIHALSYQLHPSTLEDLGLVAALKAECERFAQQASVPVNVKLGEIPEPVAPETALGLLRVTQEALRNVERHAKAHTVDVSLHQQDGGLQLAVRDDGVGFDPARQRATPHLGLASMRERVQFLGGELDIDSAPGHGTTVLAWVPLKAAP